MDISAFWTAAASSPGWDVTSPSFSQGEGALDVQICAQGGSRACSTDSRFRAAGALRFEGGLQLLKLPRSEEALPPKPWFGAQAR